MEDGRLPEFVLIAPGAPGSWFSDSHDGSKRWEEFLTGDLLRLAESRYRILPDRRSRGMTGISMGGYGAVKIALKRPDLVGSVSSLSGALIPFAPEDLRRYNWFARWTLKRVFGRSPQDNSFAANDVWEILREKRFEAPPFAAHFRGGTEDMYGLDRVAAQFASFLTEHGAPATAVLEQGGHDWEYWRRGLIRICEWHAREFSYDPK